MKKKILISTGGSGGHVVPATIFYNHLKNDFEIYLSTDIRGLNFFNQNNFKFKIINVPQIGKNFFNIFFLITATLKSIFFIKKKQIQIVISTGGYMSLPVCIAAKIMKCKIFLYEPNFVIGKSNLLFLKYCNKIFCYNNNIKNYPEKYQKKIEVINPLLRREIYEEKKNLKTKFDNKITLLIIGGSQGAEYFQNNLKDCIYQLSQKYLVKVFHQCSSENFIDLEKFYIEKKIDYKLFKFDDSLQKLIREADLCITRAGASSLAELIYLNKFFITIPFPYSKDNHQFFNASFYEKKNCCWLIEQKNMTNENCVNLISEIINNQNNLEIKLKEMQKISYQNNWNNINKKIIKVINEN